VSQPAATQKLVNVAVVGLGFMGMTHLRAYLKNPLARVRAVCDPSRAPVNGILPAVGGNIGAPEDVRLGPDVKVFRKLEDLLADPAIHLVDICTPTPLHPAQAIAALRAGKHVMCEKPLARTSAEAREIQDVARSAPGVLMPAMCMRFWSGWGFLREMVREERFGKTLSAHFFRGSEKPAWGKSWTAQGGGDLGGALFDLHIHDTDFVYFLFGRPDAVFATGRVTADGMVEHVVTQYQYPRGPVVSAEGSWLRAQGFNMGYQVQCERATIEFDLARGTEALRIIEPGKPVAVVPCGAPDGYAAEIDYLLNCLVNGETTEKVTPADAVAGLEICEAEEKSIRTQTIVPL